MFGLAAALGLVSCGPNAGPPSSQLTTLGKVEVTARLSQILGEFPPNKLYDYVYVMKCMGGIIDKHFLKQDTHWSPAGLRVVAQRIAEHLKPLLAPVDGLSLASRSEPVSHYGDLVPLPERQP